MAYLDRSRKGPRVTSVCSALGINALMVAAIIYSVPDILPQKPPTILNIVRVNPDPEPIEPRQRDKPVVKAAGRNVLVPPNPDISQQPEEARLTTTTAEMAPVGGTIEPLPLKPEPVFRPARPNPGYAGALQPGYPPGMIREEREGVVTVRVLIGTDGRVKALEAVRADAPAFLEATRRQALAKWRFLPATRGGLPVESWREMTVRFELPG